MKGSILFENPFGAALNGRVIFQITTPVWVCLICFAIFGFLLRRTTFGRNTLAIGGNADAEDDEIQTESYDRRHQDGEEHGQEESPDLFSQISGRSLSHEARL